MLTTSRFLYDSIVSVLVGPNAEHFNVHKGILCESSDFFKAALNGNFKENNGTVKLPEQKVEIFKYFIHWLYAGRTRGYYYPKTITPTITELEVAVRQELMRQNVGNLQALDLENPVGKAYNLAIYKDAPFTSLIGLYILADSLQIHNLRDQIITVLIDNYGFEKPSKPSDETDPEECPTLWWSADEKTKTLELECPSVGINMAWEKLPHNSMLCKLLVTCFCDNVTYVKKRTDQEQYHPDFLAAVADKYAWRWAKSLDVTDWDCEGEMCSYHEHGPAVECSFSTKLSVKVKTATKS